MTEQSAIETLREIRARFATLQATLEEAQDEESKAKAALIAKMAENDRLRAEISTLKGFQQNAPKDADYIVFFDSDIPELEAARARIAELEAVAQVRATPCKWSETDDGDWVTACGVDWVFTDGGPEDNDVRFCPCCGHPVELYQYEPEVEE